MIICRTIAQFRAERSSVTGTLGFVPTMGYLHAGHLSLMQVSQAQNDRTAVSIFVNPAQFNSPDDLAAYPTDEEGDLEMLQEQRVDLVFLPSAEEIYPPGFQTYVEVEQVSQGLEGASRPGHFKGVATVVAKLLNIVQPHRAYFGEKDAQQVAVVQRLVRDLGFPVEIVALPTVREPDGLAMSSRNVRLSPEQRLSANVLHKALKAAQSAFESGIRDSDELINIMKSILLSEEFSRIHYISITDANNLKSVKGTISGREPVLVSMAVFIGPVRLIDNIILRA